MTTNLPAGLTPDRADALASAITPSWEEIFGAPVHVPSTLRPPSPKASAAADAGTAAKTSAALDASAASRTKAGAGAGEAVSERGRSAKGAEPQTSAAREPSRRREAPRVGQTTRGDRPVEAVPSSGAPSSRRGAPSSVRSSERVDLPTTGLPIGKILGGVAVAAVIVTLLVIFSGDEPAKDPTPARTAAVADPAPTATAGEPPAEPQPVEPKATEPEPEPKAAEAPEPKAPEPKASTKQPEPAPVPKKPAPAPKPATPKPAPPSPTPKPGGDIVREIPF